MKWWLNPYLVYRHFRRKWLNRCWEPKAVVRRGGIRL